MKLGHKINHDWDRHVRPMTEDYQHEVDVATGRLEARYREAQARVASAERRLRKLEAERAKLAGKVATARQASRLAVARELYQMRTAELEELHRLLVASPASVNHRGSKRTHAPVPRPTYPF